MRSFMHFRIWPPLALLIVIVVGVLVVRLGWSWAERATAFPPETTHEL